MFSYERSFHDSKYRNLSDIKSIEKETVKKARTIPNILKHCRPKKMDDCRIILSHMQTNTNKRKQIFDPIKNELLIWENFYGTEAESMCDIEPEVPGCSPMWYIANEDVKMDEQDVAIIDTITINLPIKDITDMVCSKFIEPDFLEFQREMDITSVQDENNIENILEHSRFEYQTVKNNFGVSIQEKDPLNGGDDKVSWKNYECLVCGVELSSQSSLLRHLKNLHHQCVNITTKPELIMACPRCFKTYRRPPSYEQHLVVCGKLLQAREE